MYVRPDTFSRPSIRRRLRLRRQTHRHILLYCNILLQLLFLIINIMLFQRFKCSKCVRIHIIICDAVCARILVCKIAYLHTKISYGLRISTIFHHYNCRHKHTRTHIYIYIYVKRAGGRYKIIYCNIILNIIRYIPQLPRLMLFRILFTVYTKYTYMYIRYTQDMLLLL